ncbi:HutD family protein [Klebsiella quasipneumoniae]|uniref:HutD/Ves family protein n=1 Tax=Klebsiella quasipneumoniae TaxID=1463165 RepID=UPI001034567B|nr:HutD family protein [Klebsiella quasipneumoniae]EIY5104984.1 HutD family protein [Klebsiella quasipneumoniae]EIY5109492.1 HutD family protein [Klebsiella quasipneumoniae]EJC6264353.1 HutD family protein [Klebsiella quasipneumoniae]MCQ3853487.1 HutD family protein [Klebsiella quasipneumoniae]
MITYFDYATLPVTPWKNGAGATREIIAVPSVDAPFLWRASIATLQADGPFSPFPGVDRTIVLLAGQPLRLRGEEIEHPLALWQPWTFPGEWELSSVGIVEPGLDFNVMTQRGRASAKVEVVSDRQRAATEGVAYVLQGEWDLAGRRCAAGSGLCWRGNAPGELRPLGADGRLLLATIALK